MLYRFIIKNTKILEYEDKLNKEFSPGYTFNKINDKEKDMYQYLSPESLSFLYIRNNLYLERLTDKNLSFLAERINGYTYGSDCDAFIRSTFLDLIFLDDDGKQTPGILINYGPGNVFQYYAPNNAFVIGSRYNDCETDKFRRPNDMYIPSKLTVFNSFLEYVEHEMSKELQCSVKGISYNDYSAVALEINDPHKVKQCQICFRDIPSDANFCPYCGQKLL